MIRIIRTMATSLILALLVSGCTFMQPPQARNGPQGEGLSHGVPGDYTQYDDDGPIADYTYQSEFTDAYILKPEIRKSLEDILHRQGGKLYDHQQQQMAVLINEERKLRGLSPLTIDPGLSQLARFSAGALKDDFLGGGEGSDHDSMEEILASLRVEYITCGINMASGTEVLSVHDNLMGCEENRNIILNPDFTHVGIGVTRDTGFNQLYTQVFIQAVSWQPVIDEEQEIYMLELLNNERTKKGLKPLIVNEKLVEAARLKSIDLVEGDYFDHYSPTYGTPFELLEKLGIDFDKAGENLAGNMDTLEAHRGLMASKGHRANILDSEYNQVGIGVAKGGRYGRAFTQLFIYH